MANLERERELAEIEQEMMERLKAEELLFQQVRHAREFGGHWSELCQPQCGATQILKTSPSLIS